MGHFGFGSAFAAAIALFFAGAYAKAASGFLSGGYSSGGTQLSETTGGQSYRTQAGSGLLLVGGLVIPISPTTPHRFETQLGIGYMFQDDARSEEKRVSWSRIPIEASYFYRNTRALFRLGWGATYHIAGKISARGANATAETNVDNAFGWALAAEKLWSTQKSGTFALGLRYTAIKYNVAKFSKEADGNSWQVTVSSFSF